jgi:hypothetical protein
MAIIHYSLFRLGEQGSLKISIHQSETGEAFGAIFSSAALHQKNLLVHLESVWNRPFLHHADVLSPTLSVQDVVEAFSVVIGPVC